MKIYNSYANKIEEFVPINDNKVRIYVCGPTVYDFAHLGHARCYITWDMVVRYLRFRGYDVTYARNVTDVDDKIINKAKAQNSTPEAISMEFYEEFTKSLDSLNCVKPDLEPMATKTIGDMIALVKKLETNGYAYNVGGDVFFRVGKFADYGKLSNQRIEDLESGARVESDERKESPLDFALWKSVKDDSEISWPSPWGKGRPGWHLECSAMINKVFKGEAIDIHAGGQDLLFPHHENEIAQSCCAYDYKEGQPFVKYWMHNGFVTINEEKMSKSLGNFVTINKLLEQYDSNTIRFFILTNHYRMPVGFNDESLTAAQNGMKRIKNAIDEAGNFIGEKVEADINLENEYVKAFIEAMDNDFNTAKAIAILFELVGNMHRIKYILNHYIIPVYESATSLGCNVSELIMQDKDSFLQYKESENCNFNFLNDFCDEIEELAFGKIKVSLKENNDYWSIKNAIINMNTKCRREVSGINPMPISPEQYLAKLISSMDEYDIHDGKDINPDKRKLSLVAFINIQDFGINYVKSQKEQIEKAKKNIKENFEILLGLSNILGFDFTVERAVDYPEMKQKLLNFIKSDEIISKAFLGETMLAGSENIPKEDKDMFEYALKLVTTSRNKAREEKQWAYSDKIRDGLLAIGIVIKDTKEGTTWIIE